MGLSAKKRLSHSTVDSELNITPIMNVLIILIPFLVSMAVFTHYSVLKLNIDDKLNTATDNYVPSLDIYLFNTGFQIKFEDKVLSKQLNDSSYNLLKEWFTQNSLKIKDIKEVTLFTQDNIIFEKIVKVMDFCEQAGLKKIAFSSENI